MEGAFLLITFILIVKLSRGGSVPSPGFGRAFSTRSREELLKCIPDQFSNLTIEWDQGNGLRFFARQRCVDPSYLPCALDAGCCPAGWNCVPGGCCPAGEQRCGSSKCYNPTTSNCCPDGSGACPLGYDCVGGECCPAGQQLCGSSNCFDPKTHICCQSGSQVWGCAISKECCSVGFCFNPTTEQCCKGGTCPTSDSCCMNECCRPIAYCGSDGYCSACPLSATEIVTATEDFTTTRTTTITITETPESSELPDFTCAPLTVTNNANATLELDTDCSLSYIPPSTSSSTTTTNPTPGTSNRPPQRRAFSCQPAQTTTLTTTLTNTITTLGTVSRTVFAKESEAGFSCPPMTVTNQAGDVLSLDESCVLEFSTAAVSTNTGGKGPVQTTKQSTARLKSRTAASGWWVMAMALVAVM